MWQIRKKVLPPDDPLIAASHNNIAVLHKDNGRLDNAVQEMQLALAIWEKDKPTTTSVQSSPASKSSRPVSRGELSIATAHGNLSVMLKVRRVFDKYSQSWDRYRRRQH